MIPFFLTLFFIFLSAIIDAEHINRGEYIYNHRSRWLLRGTFFLAFPDLHLKAASMLLFLALFDPIIAMLIKKQWNYIGNVSKYDQMKREAVALFWILEAGSLVLSLYLFFIF